ncbi:MAG: hypothetical protein V3V25_03155 [Paracoccaceae bacterium]
MYTLLLVILALLLSLALLWSPYQLLVASRFRLMRADEPLNIAGFRGLLALGLVAAVFNTAYVANLFFGSGPLEIVLEGWLMAAMALTWLTFWANFALISFGRKRQMLQY